MKEDVLDYIRKHPVWYVTLCHYPEKYDDLLDRKIIMFAPSGAWIFFRMFVLCLCTEKTLCIHIAAISSVLNSAINIQHNCSSFSLRHEYFSFNRE